MEDDAKATAVVDDYRTAPLTERERAIADYAAKLTARPREMEKPDVEALRDAGCSDAEILDVCQIAAYFNFVNRLADGLGVELEGYW
jgi:uncharacterized peroxidase-related enzyme